MDLPAVSTAEFDAIIAALRLLARAVYEGKVTADDKDIGEIWTNSQEHSGLTSDEIHDLADRFLHV